MQRIVIISMVAFSAVLSDGKSINDCGNNNFQKDIVSCHKDFIQ